jgi:Spy/CpxP family protein refolding chaperone
MKKNILINSMVAIVTLALVASTAMARGPGYGRGQGYGPQNGCPAVSNLTAEQTSRIQAIQQTNFQEITPLREQLFAKRTELRNLWSSQSPDQAKITVLQKDMLSIRAQLQEKSNNARLEVREVLTPEQQAQIAAYGPGMGRMGGRMGRW